MKRHLWKKTAVRTISLLTAMCVMSPTAFAVTLNIADGDIGIDETYYHQNSTYGEHYNDVTITGSSETNTVTIVVDNDDSNNYTAQEGDTEVNGEQPAEKPDNLTVTLDNVTIKSSNDAAISVDVTGNKTDANGEDVKDAEGKAVENEVDIEINGTNTLTSGEGHAGIEKNDPTDESATVGKLVIQDAEGATGTLEANGGNEGGAGIGGGRDKSSSNIEISGGTVTATGGDSNSTNAGAGIGGGSYGDGTDITISGGTVTAEGGTGNLAAGGAGIGGGSGGGSNPHSYGAVGNGKNITISGEDTVVIATGGLNAAGIGGGTEADGSNIKIEGGNIKATGGESGAGIGGGYAGSGTDITISGGEVTANGGKNGAGIGSGNNIFADTDYDNSSSNITISGGTVTATGGSGAAGIGGGLAGDASNITITSETDKTDESETDPSKAVITIVTATGTNGGAGIGGGAGASGRSEGNGGNASDITITGGTVTATGGDSQAPSSLSEIYDFYTGGGAGIGGGGAYLYGESGTSTNITISGEATEVTATGGATGAKLYEYAYGQDGALGTAADIGGGSGYRVRIGGQTCYIYGGEQDGSVNITDGATVTLSNGKIGNGSRSKQEKNAAYTFKQGVTINENKVSDEDDVTEYLTSDTSRTLTIQSHEHTWKDATCTEPKTCETCGATEGDAKGHSFTSRDSGTEATAATCTAAATHYVQCDNCDVVSDTVTMNVGEAKGHSFGEATYEWSADGSTCTATRTCTVDNVSETDEATVTSVQSKAPTCTEKGATTYTAAFGEAWASEQTTTLDDVAATGVHQWGEGVVTTPATCTAEGVLTYTCAACGATKTEAIAKTEHTSVSDNNAVAATCTSEGKTASTSCSVCGTLLTAQETIAKTAHNPVAMEEIAATTTSEGRTGGTQCAACGTVLTQPTVLPALTPESNDGGDETTDTTSTAATVAVELKFEAYHSATSEAQSHVGEHHEDEAVECEATLVNTNVTVVAVGEKLTLETTKFVGTIDQLETLDKAGVETITFVSCGVSYVFNLDDVLRVCNGTAYTVTYESGVAVLRTDVGNAIYGTLA